MQIAFNSIKKQNPEFKIFLYDEKDCQEFIKKNYSNEIYHTYMCLIPQAYKSDLWRYCVLYKYGGIYYDIKFVPIDDFKFASLLDKEYFVKDPIKDEPIPEGTHFGVLNGLMIVKPKNEKILAAINTIVANVKNKYYGNNSLEITGPLMLSKFWTQKEINNFDFIFFKPNQIGTKNKKIILKMYNNYRQEQKQFGNGKRYGDLYNEKNIYSC